MNNNLYLGHQENAIKVSTNTAETLLYNVPSYMMGAVRSMQRDQHASKVKCIPN